MTTAGLTDGGEDDGRYRTPPFYRSVSVYACSLSPLGCALYVDLALQCTRSLALQCTRRDQLRAAARAVQCVPAARVIAFDSGASRGLTADMPLRNQTHATACAVQSVPGARTVCTRRALAGT